MYRFGVRDVMAVALFVVVLFFGAAGAYLNWIRDRGVDGILRDVVDDRLHPAKRKSEPARAD
jgi:hypothetical protein